MTTLVTDVIIKVETVDKISEVMGKIREIREANPHETLKVTIEVGRKD